MHFPVFWQLQFVYYSADLLKYLERSNIATLQLMGCLSEFNVACIQENQVAHIKFPHFPMLICCLSHLLCCPVQLL